jgi:ketosteroid isomerase-like protein
MSQENVDAFKRGLDAYNSRDFDAMLKELDPDVEFHPALAVLLGGEQTVFRGHQGVLEALQEEDEDLAVYQVEASEIHDLGNRVLMIGRAHIRGKGSGVPIESPFFVLTESKGTKGRDARAIDIRTYLDPKEALEAAGLSQEDAHADS